MSESLSKSKELSLVLSQFGGAFQPEFDGLIRRFAMPGKFKKSGWTVGWKVGELEVLLAGDFATLGNDFHQYTNKLRMEKSVRSDYEKKMKELAEQRRKIEAQFWDECRIINCKVDEIKVDYDASSFEYFQKKQIDKLYGGFFVKDEKQKRPYFVVPMKDQSGLIWNYQRIFSSGEKIFKKGRARGLFHVIGEPSETMFICEGFATGVSIHRATGFGVVVCFSAHNLIEVCSQIKRGDKRIIVAADNDKFIDTGKNAGLDSAKEINRRFHFEFVYPKFHDETTKPTDFNDLFCMKGADFVKAWLLGDSGGEDYLSYKDAFESSQFFRNAKKDILTGRVLYDDNGNYEPLVNYLERIRSIVTDYGLEMGQATAHLYRWMDEIKGKFLIDIPEWDGVDRIGEQFNYLNITNINKEFGNDLFKEYCANLWSRAIDNKHPNRFALFLGPMGIGKDIFIDNMFSGFGPYYVHASTKQQENDFYISASRHILINIPEFDQMDKKEVGFLKDILDSPGKEFRSAYSRESTNYRFRASFIGSANKNDVLRDETGNRKFLIFWINDVDWSYPKLNSSDKLQVVAQCRYLSESGYKADKASVEIMALELEKLTPLDPVSMAVDTFKAMMIAKFNIPGSPSSYHNSDVQKDVIFECARIHGIRTRDLQSAIKRAGLQRKIDGYYYFRADSFIIGTKH